MAEIKRPTYWDSLGLWGSIAGIGIFEVLFLAVTCSWISSTCGVPFAVLYGILGTIVLVVASVFGLIHLVEEVL